MAKSLFNSPVDLTHRVLFVTQQLGLYQAELARVLHLQCSDIGKLTSGKAWLEHGTVAWQQARLFVRFYALLYDELGGDDVAMYHWLRARHEFLKAEPLLMMVDHDQLESVIRLLVSGRGLRAK